MSLEHSLCTVELFCELPDGLRDEMIARGSTVEVALTRPCPGRSHMGDRARPSTPRSWVFVSRHAETDGTGVTFVQVSGPTRRTPAGCLRRTPLHAYSYPYIE